MDYEAEVKPPTTLLLYVHIDAKNMLLAECIHSIYIYSDFILLHYIILYNKGLLLTMTE